MRCDAMEWKGLKMLTSTGLLKEIDGGINAVEDLKVAVVQLRGCHLPFKSKEVEEQNCFSPKENWRTKRRKIATNCLD